MDSPGGTRSATRGELLELQDEHGLIREGYEFLDEKRIQLATELLRELERYKASYAEYARLHAEAVVELEGAIREHGLDDLTVYPVTSADSAELEIILERFLAVDILRAQAHLEDAARHSEAVLTSPQVRQCASRFRALIEQSAELAAHSGNLYRLSEEYQRTDRRARALENVLLPQIELEIKSIAEQLESVEQEDAIRVRVT